MLKNLLIALAAIVLILVVVVSMRPSEFRVERSAPMSAPPAAVFAHVNELRKWRAWSPWEDIDPNLQRTYEGPAEGVGASYAWAGNRDVGEGRMTITESRPAEGIRIKLEFLKPFQATNTAEFKFEPDGAGTLVVWSMAGENNFVGKAMGLLMDMDKMVGGQFEQGLARLKTVAEADAAAALPPAAPSEPAPTPEAAPAEEGEAADGR